MSGNSFGNIFRLTTFGESHGVAIGGVIDGCPPGFRINRKAIQKQLDRRRPGQSKITTSRNETDEVEFLSGLLNDMTLGTPIGFIIRNRDQRESDYDTLKDVFRPSHADFTWQQKFGIRDTRGGGRSSARETACRVVAGSIAEQMLNFAGIEICAWVSQVGGKGSHVDPAKVTRKKVDSNPVRCPDQKSAERMEEEIRQAMKAGDTLGGLISCIAKGVPAGLGEPVFDKLHADLGKAMLSINATKGFEIGSGFSAISMTGSQHNDAFTLKGKKISTETNRSGGIQGGISNGADIWFNVAFKPVSTIKLVQQTVDTSGKKVKIAAGGRHDPCVVPRAVPIVEAMTALVLIDHMMLQSSFKAFTRK